MALNIHHRLAFLLFSVLTSYSGSLLATTYEITTAEQVEALIDSGELAAGDTILWGNGEFSDVELNLEGVDGTLEDPIILRATTPGGVILRGESQFSIGTAWWVIEGFHFEGESNRVNAYNTLQFRSQSGKCAQHVRLTNCAMTDLSTDENTSKWLLMYGRFNRIDHCHFSGKNSKGALLTVELSDLQADATAEHVFERNYFGDVAFHAGSDNETIRIGFSGDQNKQAKCLVRQNVFMRCDGENEIVSSKSSYNRFEANTFRQCNGALVLRHGHHAQVVGNYFFGDGAKDAGGIRIVDSHHTIVNNYLQDLTGKRWNAAISILGGKQPSGGTGDGYQAVNQITVAHNTILNCRRSIYLNKSRGSRAPSGLVANNLISSSSGPLIAAELKTEKLKWLGNLMHGAALGASIDVSTADPQLRLLDGLLRPDPTGPVADAASPLDLDVSHDIEGRERPESGKDIGAVEVRGSLGESDSPPLEASDVGTSFLRVDGPRNETN